MALLWGRCCIHHLDQRAGDEADVAEGVVRIVDNEACLTFGDLGRVSYIMVKQVSTLESSARALSLCIHIYIYIHIYIHIFCI